MQPLVSRRDRTEAIIRAAADRGAYDEAFREALAAYGPEVVGYLAAGLRDEDLAREVFAQLALDLWKGLPGFRWESAFRTWLYRAAHYAMLRQLRRRRRYERLDSRRLEELRQPSPVSTPRHLRSPSKSWLDRVRSSLTVDEQTMLTLRLDRGMSWQEIALVLGEAEARDGRGLRRASASLRKRFERLKARLRARAEADGILAPDE